MSEPSPFPSPPPFADERVIHCTERLLVVDKPSGLPVHGGAVVGADLVGRLAAWLRARGEAEYLAVHQRLDLGTSGVLLFGRDPALNAALARAMEAHEVRREYVAITRDVGGPSHGLMEDQLITSRGSRGMESRLVSRGGKPCRARFQVLKRGGGRAWVALFPETGRTHQLRVQLAARGMPVLGDLQYGGEPAPAARLMLHARRLEHTGLSLSFEAPVPAAFEHALRGDSALGLEAPRDLEARLLDAWVARYPLPPSVHALRLVHELGDALPGVSIDAYAEYAVLSVASDEARVAAPRIAEWLLGRGFRGVYLKLRPRADLRAESREALAPAAPLAGEPAPEVLTVREGEARYLVRLADGLSTGLFIDQRDNREKVRRMAAGARVLNLFSYTCSFTVAAALGGARETVSVDLSGRYLAWGRENLALNQLASEAHRFIRADAADTLRRARARGERFDLVVLDPPSFGAHGKKSFSVARDYPKLAEDAAAVLAPGGRLLAVTNHRKTSAERLRGWLSQGAGRAGITARLEAARSGADCPAWPGGESPTKAFWLQRT